MYKRRSVRVVGVCMTHGAYALQLHVHVLTAAPRGIANGANAPNLGEGPAG